MNEPSGASGTALLTDRYELTMLAAARHSGTAERRCVFEMFARRLPPGRRYGVLAGTGRALAALADFRPSDDELGWLRDTGLVDRDTAAWLESYRFGGDVLGYAEGEVYVPGSPLLTVEGTFAEAVLLETLLLSIHNHDSAVAAAASRMTAAAGDRPCLEMGSRRTHEQAAVAAARAAHLAGFEATSNLAAGRRHAISTVGTSAHAFTLLHDSERDAFTAQVESLGAGTTLLVDTYDVAEAVGAAVEVAGTDLGAVRIDSGDLPSLAAAVRAQLDALGATGTRIVVTSDLDEHAIAALAQAPVDAYGVGTSLVTGSGHPTCGFVYKMVAREDADGVLRTVAKRSAGKADVGGRKQAWRRTDADGTAVAEVVGPADHGVHLDDASHRPLQLPLVVAGDVVRADDLVAARERHALSRAELPQHATRLSRGEPALPTVSPTEESP